MSSPPVDAKMSSRRPDYLVAKPGTISGFLFENRHIKLPRTLFHSIEVPLQSVDKRTKTAIQLDFIQLPDLPFRGYRALVGRTLKFPINPKPGYIDGSVYLDGEHEPIDVV